MDDGTPKIPDKGIWNEEKKIVADFGFWTGFWFGSAVVVVVVVYRPGFFGQPDQP